MDHQLSCLGAESFSAHQAAKDLLPHDIFEGSPDCRVLVGIHGETSRQASDMHTSGGHLQSHEQLQAESNQDCGKLHEEGVPLPGLMSRITVVARTCHAS